MTIGDNSLDRLPATAILKVSLMDHWSRNLTIK